MAEKDLNESGAVVEACIQKKQIAFFEVLDKFENEFMFRSGCFAVDEAQRCTADQVKEAAKLHSNGSQSLLAIVCAEKTSKEMVIRAKREWFCHQQADATHANGFAPLCRRFAVGRPVRRTTR